ncbi:MAG: AAA family ATPase [Bacteroidales bacterium]|nr:AAA family ATPase [Bacteroidales bacterium]
MAKKDWMIRESELDDDQIQILQATLDKSCVVSGCAGSGKSVLALIKAQRIQKEKGDDYQIIVFTKALCSYMNSGRELLGLKKQFDYHWHWKNRKNCPSSDYIIVDEIQDFTKEEIFDFIHATKRNFFFFGDTAQSIYEGLKTTIPVKYINRLFPFGKEPKDWDLYRNYRLPLPVAKVSKYIGLDLDAWEENVYKSREREIPRFLEYPNMEEQIKAIVKIVKNLNLTDVGILLPHNQIVEETSNILNSYDLSHEAKWEDKSNWRNSVNSLNFNTTNPKVMTYHSAKGLQFEAVFLPCITHLSDDENRKISEQKALYVAMTRTYRYLYVMYSGVLPYPLSNVPKELYKTTEIDEVEEI